MRKAVFALFLAGLALTGCEPAPESTEKTSPADHEQAQKTSPAPKKPGPKPEPPPDRFVWKLPSYTIERESARQLEEVLSELKQNQKHTTQMLPSRHFATQEHILRWISRNANATMAVVRAVEVSPAHKKNGVYQLVATLEVRAGFQQLLNFINSLESSPSLNSLTRFSIRPGERVKDMDDREVTVLDAKLTWVLHAYDPQIKRRSRNKEALIPAELLPREGDDERTALDKQKRLENLKEHVRHVEDLAQRINRHWGRMAAALEVTRDKVMWSLKLEQLVRLLRHVGLDKLRLSEISLEPHMGSSRLQLLCSGSSADRQRSRDKIRIDPNFFQRFTSAELVGSSITLRLNAFPYVDVKPVPAAHKDAAVRAADEKIVQAYNKGAWKDCVAGYALWKDESMIERATQVWKRSLYLKAQAHLNLGQPKEAERTLRTLIATQGNHGPGLALGARVQMQLARKAKKRRKEPYVMQAKTLCLQAARSGYPMIHELNQDPKLFGPLRNDPQFLLRVVKATVEIPVQRTGIHDPFVVPK